MPREYAHLPVLGTIRNPWEFYVSWYQHQKASSRYTPLFCTISDNRNLDFVNTIRNALDLGVDAEKLRVLIDALPDEFNFTDKHIPNLTKGLMAKIRGTGLGLYSFRFNQLFGPIDDVHFCRVESLREDLVKFFDKIGITDSELRDYVLSSDKKNTSEHLHYSLYYPGELADLVAIRDRSLIDRFSYGFQNRVSHASIAASH